MLVIISGDEAAADPGVRALAERATHVIGIGMFEESFAGLADLVLPGTSYLERDGTTAQPRGPPPAPAPHRDRARAPTSSPGSRSSPSASTSSSRRTPRVVFEEVSERCYGGISFGDGRRAGRAPDARDRHRPRSPKPADKPRQPGQGPAPPHLPAALLRPGRRPHARARVPAPRGRGRARAAPTRAQRKIVAGDEVTVSSNGTIRRAPRPDRARPAGRQRPRPAHRRRGPPRPRRGGQVKHLTRAVVGLADRGRDRASTS